MLPFENTWLPFIYLYGVGGIFSLMGMILIRKTGAVDFSKKRHVCWYKVLIIGFIYFVILHALLILAALYL
jgi:hypothetical protein